MAFKFNPLTPRAIVQASGSTGIQGGADDIWPGYPFVVVGLVALNVYLIANFSIGIYMLCKGKELAPWLFPWL